MSAGENFTRLLRNAQAGDRESLDQILPLVYGELRSLAQKHLARERNNHTLQPTALVHEAYLRLLDQNQVDWKNRTHFFSIAAEMMRRILVNYAVQRNAKKRGGELTRIQLDEAVSAGKENPPELIKLDNALKELEEFDPGLGRLVELRFFGGLTIEETAEVLEISASTVKRDWRTARAWLRPRL